LRFEDKPDYDYLHRLFRDLMTKQNLEFNYDFDWIHIEDDKSITLTPQLKGLLHYLL